MDAGSAGLDPDGLEHRREELHILLGPAVDGRGDGTLAREPGPAVKLLPQPALHVRGDEQRDLGELLQFLQPAGSALDVPAEQDEAADALPDERFDLAPVGRVLKGSAVDPRHYHLRDRSFQFGHGAHFLFFTRSLQVFFACSSGTTFAVDKTLQLRYTCASEHSAWPQVPLRQRQRLLGCSIRVPFSEQEERPSPRLPGQAPEGTFPYARALAEPRESRQEYRRLARQVLDIHFLYTSFQSGTDDRLRTSDFLVQHCPEGRTGRSR